MQIPQDYLDVTLPLLSPSTCTTVSSNCSGSTLVCGGAAGDEMDTTGSTLTAPDSTGGGSVQYTQASPTYSYGPTPQHAHSSFDHPPPYVNEEAAVFSQNFPMPPPTLGPMSQVSVSVLTLGGLNSESYRLRCAVDP